MNFIFFIICNEKVNILHLSAAKHKYFQFPVPKYGQDFI